MTTVMQDYLGNDKCGEWEDDDDEDHTFSNGEALSLPVMVVQFGFSSVFTIITAITQLVFTAMWNNELWLGSL